MPTVEGAKAKPNRFLYEKISFGVYEVWFISCNGIGMLLFNCSSHTRTGLIWMIGALLAALGPASAQETTDLQQQLQQLKQQYEETAHDLQQRIATLEQQIQEQQEQQTQKKQESAEKAKERTISAAELAVEGAAKTVAAGESNQVGANFQGKLSSEPTYDLLQEADQKIEKLEQQVGTFEFHGYFRSGYGLNSAGGQQVAFEAPGTEAKYRLGNEAETYGELIFVNNWLNPNHASDKAWMKTEFMVEANTTNSTSYTSFPSGVGNDQYRFREAFVEAGNVFESQPDAKFWAGERYYRRQHIDIDDFYLLDLSGYGAGVEDLNVRFGKMAVAFLNAARPDIVTENGNLAKSNIDLRFYDLKGPTGLWAAWFDFATSKGGQTSARTRIPTTDGYSFGLRHQRLEWHGGYHMFSIQYGTGAAANFSSGGSGTYIVNPTPFIDKSRQLLATEQVLFQPNDRFAIMPIAIYQRTKDGNPQHGWNQWVSFGARPELFFTKHLSLAFEAGFDHTRCALGCMDLSGNPSPLYDGWLRKFTIAPQIGAGRKFFSRPVLRVFLTYANWSDGLRGFVGGVPFQDRTSGLTYGVQAETWF